MSFIGYNITYLYHTSQGICEGMIKQARTAGLLKLKTTVLILALVLCTPLTTASASQILIEDADTIWNITSDYPQKLINTTENVTARITAEYANTIYCADLNKVPVALANLSQTVVPSRLIFVSASTNHCEELIYPKEFMDDTIPPVITDISVINLVNNSAKVTWKTDEFADSVLKKRLNSVPIRCRNFVTVPFVGTSSNPLI